jgi:hypothetical protein
VTTFPTPDEAALHFAQAIQDTASCVCPALFNFPIARPVEQLQALVLDRGNDVPLGSGLYLSAGHWYSVEAVAAGYVVKTGGYAYTIESDHVSGEVASWQWHPEAESWCAWPHLHVRAPLGDHLPTSRVAFEQVVRWLIVEANIPPLRADWEVLLTQNEQDWRARRSWA